MKTPLTSQAKRAKDATTEQRQRAESSASKVSHEIYELLDMSRFELTLMDLSLLDLSETPINFAYIRILQLNDNLIETVDFSSLITLRVLEEINLSNNRIRTITGDLSSTVKTLNLSNNSITGIFLTQIHVPYL